MCNLWDNGVLFSSDKQHAGANDCIGIFDDFDKKNKKILKYSLPLHPKE